jgi:hypothetical protein
MLKDSDWVLPRPEKEMIGRHPTWGALVSVRGGDPQPTDNNQAQKNARPACRLLRNVMECG